MKGVSVTDATSVSVVVGAWALAAAVVALVAYAVAKAVQRQAEALEVDPFSEPWGDL